jgi:prepilin-type N-terminal cleavage/methylation domain-containing protein
MLNQRLRGGFSLPEVLIATVVMGVLLVPVMFMFLSTSGSAGQDIRVVKASMLAQEMIEQVIAAQRNLPNLYPVPAENGTGLGGKAELDVEQYLKNFPGELGVPLFSGKVSTMVSRMYLSPEQPNFHRYLTIAYEQVGKEEGKFLTPPALFRVTARVHFVTPLAGRDLSRDVTLSTFLYTDASRVDVHQDYE